MTLDIIIDGRYVALAFLGTGVALGMILMHLWWALAPFLERWQRHEGDE
jgi:hypothetical protein